ncbi:hypothetical protein SASPL_110616 [Salvia splendens]|uniref:Uncharacterized protein n=1 Tax=Salvia splendens TaxID=180675 RepID=A0A8X8YAU5_SALSN|nr:uncharacterized protein LOC121800565 [Salvia splendens]KAG6426393.1 hypothetical protein SASPL_110616 [Salvia splendens]
MFLFSLVFYFGFDHYYDGEIDDGNNGGPHQGIRRRVMIILFKLWICLSSLSLVSATGSTFFLLEATALVARQDNLFSVLILANLVKCVEIMASELSRWGVTYLNQKLRFRISYMELMRIGMGIGFCFVCCTFAIFTATNRMYGGGAMSMYGLILQFFFLGLMRGFAKDGFQSVFESIVHPRYKIYGRCLGVLTRGCGSLLSLLYIYIFGFKRFHLFQYDLENSKLIYYYIILILFSVFCGVLYVVLMFLYIGTGFLKEET